MRLVGPIGLHVDDFFVPVVRLAVEVLLACNSSMLIPDVARERS